MGENRRPVMSGKMDYRSLSADIYYPGKMAIDMYGI